MNAFTTVIDQSTISDRIPKPKIEGARLVAPDTLKLIVTDGYELYYKHDDTDNHGNAFAVLGFREKFFYS